MAWLISLDFYCATLVAIYDSSLCTFLESFFLLRRLLERWDDDAQIARRLEHIRALKSLNLCHHNVPNKPFTHPNISRQAGESAGQRESMVVNDLKRE